MNLNTVYVALATDRATKPPTSHTQLAL